MGRRGVDGQYVDQNIARHVTVGVIVSAPAHGAGSERIAGPAYISPAVGGLVGVFQSDLISRELVMVDVSVVGDGLFLLIYGVFLIHIGDSADQGGLFTAAGE